MGGKINRELTIVEGREPNQKMANELVDSAKKAGFSVKLIKQIDAAKIAENKLNEVFSDMVLWRGPVGYSHNFEIDRALIWLNDNVKVHLNTTVCGGRINTSNKYFQHGLFYRDPVLKKHILPMFPAISRENVERLISDGELTLPFVLKPDLGTRGEGIVLIRKKEDLDKFTGNYMVFSAEPYVKSEYDWRVFVLGGVALGTMKKIGDESDESDFMAKSGGRVRMKEDDVEIREELYDLAVRAAAVSGLEYAGVDLIRDDNTGKYIILETNIAGGWQNGFYGATGVYVPAKIMEWFSDRADLFEKPVSESVKNYVEKRLANLSRNAQAEYREIVDMKREISRDRWICNFDIEARDMPLVRKLSSAYALIQNYDLTEAERVKIEMLIAEVEKYEISKFGNFVEKESGSLEQSIIPTAYYLAISSKL